MRTAMGAVGGISIFSADPIYLLDGVLEFL